MKLVQVAYELCFILELHCYIELCSDFKKAERLVWMNQMDV